MPTARDIVTRALRMLGVLAAGETPSAEDADAGLLALNGMVASLVMSRAPSFAEMTLDTSIPYPRQFDEALASMLAIRLASEYGQQVAPAVASMAERGEQQLRAYYASEALLVVDSGLLGKPAPDDVNMPELTWGDL